MKNIFYPFIIIAMVLISCNAKNKDAGSPADVEIKAAEALYSCPMHPAVTGHKGEKCSKCGMELTVPVTSSAGNDADQRGLLAQNSSQTEMATVIDDFSMSVILANYLKIKNALVKDDANAAAVAAKGLYGVFANVNPATVDAKNRKQYLEIADSAKEHAGHIGAHATKIDQQREDFVLLSKDINDLIDIFPAGQKLYQDYCPMADGGKGAIWISETKDIKNPYFGSSMLKCGSVKKQF